MHLVFQSINRQLLRCRTRTVVWSYLILQCPLFIILAPFIVIMPLIQGQLQKILAKQHVSRLCFWRQNAFQQKFPILHSTVDSSILFHIPVQQYCLFYMKGKKKKAYINLNYIISHNSIVLQLCKFPFNSYSPFLPQR